MAYKENIPSKLLEDAVDAISSLPGVGRRSAMRLALHILKQPQENVHHFAQAIVNLRDDENTGQYHGVYHVLGGIISPINGVGPSDLTIRELVQRVADVSPSHDMAGERHCEVVLALSGDVEGETTSFYIYRQLSQYNVKVTSLARGLGFGDDLEYADELTLGRSIAGRQPFRP